MAVLGIFDSGSGGLSVYREILKLLPCEKYIYFADTAWCPYGEKSAEQIRERACRITELLLSKGANIIVIACNTATSAAISYLRKHYSNKFVGMEPALKPAALGTKSGVIGVLATAGTLKGFKYLQSKEIYEEDVRIEERVGDGFVELVEKGETIGEDAERIVEKSLKPLLESGADTIVLGCTHYPFLRETIEKLAGKGIKVIDPAPAVARRVAEVIEEEKIPFEKTCKAPNIELMSSGPIESLLRTYRQL